MWRLAATFVRSTNVAALVVLAATFARSANVAAGCYVCTFYRCGGPGRFGSYVCPSANVAALVDATPTGKVPVSVRLGTMPRRRAVSSPACGVVFVQAKALVFQAC